MKVITPLVCRSYSINQIQRARIQHNFGLRRAQSEELSILIFFLSLNDDHPSVVTNVFDVNVKGTGPGRMNEKDFRELLKSTVTCRLTCETSNTS